MIFFCVWRIPVWFCEEIRAYMKKIVATKSRHSDICSGSDWVFQIFGYFDIGVYNPFWYFYTSDWVWMF